MNTHCSNGHRLTDDNVRRRRGSRANHRECLTCYRNAAARRNRSGLPTDPFQNRARTVRKRAQRLGLEVKQNGASLTITNNGVQVYEGAIEGAEDLVHEAFQPCPPGPNPQTMPDAWAQALALWIADLQAAKCSARTIRLRINHVMMFARARPALTPRTVRREDFVQYFNENLGWSPSTTQSFRSSLRALFRFLCEIGYRRDDPAKTLPAVRLPRSVPRPCPDDAVVQALASTPDPRVRLALRLAIETGMRRIEIAGVRPADVSLLCGGYSIHIVGKGSHARSVPISDDLAEVLLSFTTEYVFEAPTGGPLTPEHVGKLVSQALPGRWTTHTLRHRFATTAYRATKDLRAVQELLGHASPSTTAIYTKVADDSMRRAAAAARIEMTARSAPR